MREAIPYTTLVELGAIGRELNEARQGISATEDRLAGLLTELAGSMASDQAADDFWNQFIHDVEARGDGTGGER